MADSSQKKPLASISLDLDNQWSYMKTHGDRGWEEFPSYLDNLIPRVLEIFERLDLRITFFIVGQDAALDKNKEALELITEKGHEVGNHSFHHEPWLHLYPEEEIERDIAEAESHIQRVTGQSPTGFRGPGYSWSPELLRVLQRRGYFFDASTFPTYLGPIARTYYFWTADLSGEEKRKRRLLFGSFKEGMRPVKPYLWELSDSSTLLELPVTTIPIVKIPFHLSYLIYLARFSTVLTRFYLKLALHMCLLTKTEPSFLLHPLDFLDENQVPELSFFPGMDVDAETKTAVFMMVLRELSRNFELVHMRAHAESILTLEKLKTIPCIQPVSDHHSDTIDCTFTSIE